MKKWRSEEFTAEVEGIGVAAARSRVADQVCAFLDEQNLTPASVQFLGGIEIDQLQGKQIVITRVYYRA